jgi:dTDP-4-dehydrorhamnose 3,5-epimerase
MRRSSNFELQPTKLAGVFQGKILSRRDERGYFERVFCVHEYEESLGRRFDLVQINRSMSKIRGTTRGLHFQWPPFAETKIVSCSRGRLMDVAVDLRKGSDTYLHSVSVELSADNKTFLVIPEGFAHGFQTLEEKTEILYLVTREFSLQHDDGINPTDPAIGIEWPLEISITSDKDKNRKFIAERDFLGIELNSETKDQHR